MVLSFYNSDVVAREQGLKSENSTEVVQSDRKSKFRMRNMTDKAISRCVVLGKHETIRFNIMVVGESGLGTTSHHAHFIGD